MRFGDGEIEAFLTIGNAKVNFDGRGLVHISGISDETAADSNGAGKSSIGDALAWCVWGETARGVAGDDVVNQTLGKGTRVAWTIHDGTETYQIVRHRKYPKLKNALQVFINGVEATKGTTPETQKLIEKLLGCSQEVFNSAVYSGQEAMPDLPAMTDKSLKLLVEEAAGVDVLSRAYEIAKEGARDVAAKRGDAQITLDLVTDRHASTLDQIARQTTSRDSWNAGQTTRIAEARQAAVTAATDAKVAKDALNPQEQTDLEAAIAATRNAIAAVSSEQVRERELASDVQKVREAQSTIARKIAVEENALRSAEGVVTRGAQALTETKAGVGKPCSTCTRPLEAEHLQAAIDRAQEGLDRATAERDQLAASLNATRAKVPALEKLAVAADQSLADHRAAMTDITAETQRLDAQQRELSILQAASREVDRMIVLARQANERFKQIAAETNPYEGMLGDLDVDLKKWADAQRDALAAVTALDEQLAYANAVVDVYAPNGVRAHRLDEATPFLNERTAHYLGSLTDGLIEAYWTTLTLSRNGKDLQEKFSIAVEKAGSAPTFKALSGGEKRKVRLACFLALQDLVASRASKSIELFIGDEIDDALDPAGLERLMGVLEEKARDRGTVLVISHNDIGAYCRNTMIVEKKNGISEVRTA